MKTPSRLLVALALVCLPLSGFAAKPASKTPPPAEEKEPEIPGVTIERPDGTFLGLEVVDGKFKLSFYDEKKKAVPVNVTRATARWPDPRGPGDNRTVLNPAGDGKSLVGIKFVTPPLNFRLFLTLVVGEGDNAKAVETHFVLFRG